MNSSPHFLLTMVGLSKAGDSVYCRSILTLPDNYEIPAAAKFSLDTVRRNPSFDDNWRRFSTGEEHDSNDVLIWTIGVLSIEPVKGYQR